MPSDHMSEKKVSKSSQVGAPPPEPEHLPCPRCDSTNTKFCYYNNYNFSQPRHFCKSCRRYWTHGGTLRDIPVGGGSRKNAKRSRTTIVPTNHTASTCSDSFSSVHHDFHHFPATSSQLLIPFAADHCGAMPFVTDAKPMCGSFTSLLNTQGTGPLALGGFGLGIGIGSGLEDVGVGFGRAIWPFPGAVEGGLTSGSVGMVSNTWQIESGDNGFVGGGDCFNLPDLAISTHGIGMK